MATKTITRKTHTECHYEYSREVQVWQANNSGRYAKLTPNNSDQGQANDWYGVEFTDTDEFGGTLYYRTGFDGPSSVFGNMDKRDALLLARAWVKRGA